MTTQRPQRLLHATPVREVTLDGVRYRLTYDPDLSTIEAQVPDHDDDTVGSLTWGEDGVIGDVYVCPESRRVGLATAMLELAREFHPNLAHEDAPERLSPEGAAWATATPLPSPKETP